jgi:hypothetical protein
LLRFQVPAALAIQTFASFALFCSRFPWRLEALPNFHRDKATVLHISDFSCMYILFVGFLNKGIEGLHNIHCWPILRTRSMHMHICIRLNEEDEQ